MNRGLITRECIAMDTNNFILQFFINNRKSFQANIIAVKLKLNFHIKFVAMHLPTHLITEVLHLAR